MARRSLFLWSTIIIFLNGVISFAYAVWTWEDTTVLWALLTVNFLFYTGITQASILFSAVMRISRSEWGKPFSRLSESVTISSMPLAFAVLILLYLGGTEHIFHRGSGGFQDSFLWRNIAGMAAFYFTSYIYFRNGGHSADAVAAGSDLNKRLNILASLVMLFYVIANTSMAWDFGITILSHWESTIFPPYFWVGNIFGGTAFLFIISLLFPESERRETIQGRCLNPMGKLLLGYTLLWVYMFWAQYFVIWYGDIPRLTEPLFRQMRGNYSQSFLIMMITAFILPFVSLLQRRVRSSAKTLSIIAVLICTGIYINRYLMILPLFSDGSRPAATTWTGLSLTGAGFAMTLLSLMVFLRFTSSGRQGG